MEIGLEATIRTLLKRHARLRIGVDYLTADANLFDAGLDSLAMVNLMLAIEDRFGIELSEEMLTRDTFSSISSLDRVVGKLQAETV